MHGMRATQLGQGIGLRRRMVTGNKTVDYLLDGQSVVRELTTENGQQNITATYLVGPRGPEYKRDGNGAVQWYLYDGLGSVVGLVDSSGNVTNTRKYDVYGAPRNAQTGSAHCFVGGLGHTSDAETGLVYMRARYMDPATGRFVSEDPAGDGANWFVYCSNNPVGLIDSDGHAATAGRESAHVGPTARELMLAATLLLKWAGRLFKLSLQDIGISAQMSIEAKQMETLLGPAGAAEYAAAGKAAGLRGGGRLAQALAQLPQLHPQEWFSAVCRPAWLQ